MVSKGLLEELRLILKEDYGQDLTPEQVFGVGNTLVGYFDLLSKFECRKPLKAVKENDNEHNDRKGISNRYGHLPASKPVCGKG